MRLSPLAAVVAACVLTLSACGGDDEEPTSKSEPTDTASTSPPNINGGDEGKKEKKGKKDKAPDLGDLTICEAIDTDELAELMGENKVKSGEIVNNTCTFTDPQDPAGAYVSFSQVSLESVGGEDAFVAGIEAFGDEAEEISVGDHGYVYVAGSSGGLSVSTAAAVVDESVVQVSASADENASEDDTRDRLTQLLELAVEAL